jgi:hypothetical protein
VQNVEMIDLTIAVFSNVRLQCPVQVWPEVDATHLGHTDTRPASLFDTKMFSESMVGCVVSSEPQTGSAAHW